MSSDHDSIERFATWVMKHPHEIGGGFVRVPVGSVKDLIERVHRLEQQVRTLGSEPVG